MQRAKTKVVRRRRPIANVTLPADLNAWARAQAEQAQVSLSEIMSRGLLLLRERAERAPEEVRAVA